MRAWRWVVLLGAVGTAGCAINFVKDRFGPYTVDKGVQAAQSQLSRNKDDGALLMGRFYLSWVDGASKYIERSGPTGDRSGSRYAFVEGNAQCKMDFSALRELFDLAESEVMVNRFQGNAFVKKPDFKRGEIIVFWAGGCQGGYAEGEGVVGFLLSEPQIFHRAIVQARRGRPDGDVYLVKEKGRGTTIFRPRQLAARFAEGQMASNDLQKTLDQQVSQQAQAMGAANALVGALLLKGISKVGEFMQSGGGGSTSSSAAADAGPGWTTGQRRSKYAWWNEGSVEVKCLKGSRAGSTFEVFYDKAGKTFYLGPTGGSKYDTFDSMASINCGY